MWKHSSRLLPALLLLWQLQPCAANFTFSYSAATECDDFQISWQGGVGPFHLTLLPSYGTPRIFDIPATAFSNNRGTFKTSMIVPEKKEVLAIMSDSTGYGSGGASPVITVGKQVGNTQCNLTDPGVDFFYQTNSALVQCRSYLFEKYPDAVQPVTIKGVVPGGNVFILNPPRGASFDWLANVAAGTKLTFYMQDANGRQGGSTEFMTVGISDESTCLDKTSPASVTNAPSMTSTTAASKPTGKNGSGKDGSASNPDTTAPPSDSANSSNAGTVAAAIVGTIIALVVVGSLFWFYLRRRNGGRSMFGGFFGPRFQKQEIDLIKGDTGPPPHASLSPYPLYTQQEHDHPDVTTPNSSVNLLQGRRSEAPSAFGGASSLYFAHPPNPSAPPQLPSDARPDSYRDSAFGGASAYGSASGYGGAYGSASAYGASAYGGVAAAAARPEGSLSSWERDQSVTSSAARRKAAQAGVSDYQPPARFILHTDIEDDIPPPPVDEVIELPPQYTERRAPTANAPLLVDPLQDPFSDQEASRRPS